MPVDIVSKKKVSKKKATPPKAKTTKKPAKTTAKKTTTKKATATKKVTKKKLNKKELKILDKLGLVVDKYGKKKAQLAKKQEKLAPLAKKVGELETSILDTVSEILPANQGTTVKGENYEMEVKAKGLKTTITDIEAAIVMLDQVKEGLAIELATYSLTTLKEYLTPEQYAEVTKGENVNKRGTKLVKV